MGFFAGVISTPVRVLFKICKTRFQLDNEDSIDIRSCFIVFHDHASLHNLTLHHHPSPLFRLPNLKHDLRAHKQSTARRQQEHPPTQTPHNTINQPLQTVQPDREADQIRRHHHQNISDSTYPTQPAVHIRPIFVLFRREQVRSNEFRQHEQHH